MYIKPLIFRRFKYITNYCQISKSLFSYSNGKNIFNINLKRNISTFLISSNDENRTYQISIMDGSYETMTVTYDFEINFTNINYLSKMASYYNLNDWRSAIVLMEELNSSNSSWCLKWPAGRMILMFFGLLEKNKKYESIVRYYKFFIKQGFTGTYKLNEFMFEAFLHTRDFKNGILIIDKLKQQNQSNIFYMKAMSSFAHVLPLSQYLDLCAHIRKYLTSNTQLRGEILLDLIGYLFKHNERPKSNDSLDYLKSKDKFNLAFVFFRILRELRYEISPEAANLIAIWFRKNLSRKYVNTRYIRMYTNNIGKCHHCLECMSKFPIPCESHNLLPMLEELMTNITSSINISHEQIQKEFSNFCRILRQNYKIYSIIDFSNIRNQYFYKSMMKTCDPYNIQISNQELWNHYSQFWYPVLYNCPPDAKILCVSPIFISNELRFLTMHQNFELFSTRYIKEDILCIYACAYSYYMLIRNYTDQGIYNPLRPKIISNDRFQDYLHYCTKNNVSTFSRWLYHTRGEVVPEHDTFKFKTKSFDRNVKISINGIHFPISDGSVLCVHFLNR